MNSNKSLKIIIPVILTITILLFSGCITEIDSPELPKRGFYMGILPLPSSNQEIKDAFIQASQYSEFVPFWSNLIGATSFWEFASDIDSLTGKLYLNQYIRGNNMFPIMSFSFIDKGATTGDLILKTPENMPDATLSDHKWRELYKDSIIKVVNSVKPLYLSIGNEVNRWYEQYGIDDNDPNGFQNYVSLYEEIYNEVKQISPETFVFCVFSREIVDENRVADLNVLNLFDSGTIDVLVFTSYPYAVSNINKPGDIPDDYYKQASNYFPDKKFGFTELGWSSMEAFGGEQGQADFLLNVSSKLTIEQGINLHLFGYCWLHDISDQDTTGLIKRDGTEKLAYQTWREISEQEIIN